MSIVRSLLIDEGKLHEMIFQLASGVGVSIADQAFECAASEQNMLR
jgi:hypothetical protein